MTSFLNSTLLSAVNAAAVFAAHTHGHTHDEHTGIAHYLLHAVQETAVMLPLLFLAFVLMEYIEHKASDKLAGLLKNTGGGRAGGAVLGALIGSIPQCGFSVVAANLYSGRVITMGTLAAVFLSTSDEAIPVLLSHPDKIGMIAPLLLTKIAIAVIFGILIDVALRMLKIEKDDAPDYEEFCAECGCGNHGIWYSALVHTIKIGIFILIVNAAMGVVMGLAGEEAISRFLEKMGIFQPFVAGLVGLIPNCAASVLITELYADGAIPFGSAVAGLCTGAGLGFAVLFRSNKNIKENLTVLGIVYAVGTAAGIVINLFCQ